VRLTDGGREEPGKHGVAKGDGDHTYWMKNRRANVLDCFTGTNDKGSMGKLAKVWAAEKRKWWGGPRHGKTRRGSDTSTIYKHNRGRPQGGDRKAQGKKVRGR